MAKFKAGDKVQGRADAGRETIQGKQGTIIKDTMIRSLHPGTPMESEPTYDVQFDGIDELEVAVTESSKEEKAPAAPTPSES